MKDSERILAKYDDHSAAANELEAEAAAAGRRLTDDEKAYMQDLRTEGSAILDAADRASKQETGEFGPAPVHVDDGKGNILTPKEQAELAAGSAKSPVASGGRLAD